jgi:tRNA threonylcarbamoyladenosine biosynthesis protein TsaE
MEIIFSLDQLSEVAKAVINHANHRVLSIEGPMGAGKTTLISAICKTLSVAEEVNSPTFALVNTYQAQHDLIYHFDFYRLEHPDEALDFGVEEYFESGAYCFLEWAEKITPHLPFQYNRYQITILNTQKRKLTALPINTHFI